MPWVWPIAARCAGPACSPEARDGESLQRALRFDVCYSHPMEESFTFKCNHLIGHSGDVRALIDTGCPASAPSTWLGAPTSCVEASRGPMGSRSRWPRSGTPPPPRLLDINCLVGMDILGAQPVTFDMRRRVLVRRGAPFGCNAPLEIVAGIPVLRVQVLGLAMPLRAGHRGGPLLPSEAAPRHRPCPRRAGVQPLARRALLSPIRVLPVTLFKREFHLEVGELPQILEDDLSTAEIDGVMATSYWNQGK